MDIPPVSTWINTTPHEIVIYDVTGTKVIAKIPESKEFAMRMREVPSEETTLESGVTVRRAPVYQGFAGKFPADSAPILVSQVVAQQMQVLMPRRKWVLTPDSGPGGAVRDAKGAIVGVKAVCMWQ